MQLGFLMLTDHSEVLNGKVYAMGGGWNMLHFPELPVEHGFGALETLHRHRAGATFLKIVAVAATEMGSGSYEAS